MGGGIGCVRGVHSSSKKKERIKEKDREREFEEISIIYMSSLPALLSFYVNGTS